MQTHIAVRFSNESRHHAQLIYVRALESLRSRGKLTPQEQELLMAQRPVGIDRDDLVVLEYNAKAAQKPGGSPAAALVRLSREMARLGLAPRLKMAPARGPAGRAGPPQQAVAFLPTRLVATTLPHRQVKGGEFTRVNGRLRMSLVAPSGRLPYGVYPRLALMHLTTQALLQRTRRFTVGMSANDFLATMGVRNGGGRHGASTRAREQIRRLCHTTFHWEGLPPGPRNWRGVLVGASWEKRATAGLQVTLSESFFALAKASSVPLDAGIAQKLRRSPLALDTYAWLTWRVATLTRETRIPWRSLEQQFGCQLRSLRHFRWKFRRSLKRVTGVWEGVQAEPGEHGLIIRPSPPSVLAWMDRHTARARTSIQPCA